MLWWRGEPGCLKTERPGTGAGWALRAVPVCAVPLCGMEGQLCCRAGGAGAQQLQAPVRAHVCYQANSRSLSYVFHISQSVRSHTLFSEDLSASLFAKAERDPEILRGRRFPLCCGPAVPSSCFPRGTSGPTSLPLLLLHTVVLLVTFRGCSLAFGVNRLHEEYPQC